MSRLPEVALSARLPEAGPDRQFLVCLCEAALSMTVREMILKLQNAQFLRNLQAFAPFLCQ
jgi:hypothetical protein